MNTTKLRCILCAVLAMALMTLTGCGGGVKVPKGELYGKVMYHSQPVTGGTIKIFPATGGEPIRANVGPDGTYRVTSVPAGEVKATIDTTELKQVKAPPKGIALGGGRPAYVAIPGKYTKPETANLSAEVKNGPREWNIELAD